MKTDSNDLACGTVPRQRRHLTLIFGFLDFWMAGRGYAVAGHYPDVPRAFVKFKD
jgi:hypothetical protein